MTAPQQLEIADTTVGSSASNRTLVSGDRTFHLIGTAHVSKKSVEEVEQVIRELRPDTVCIELDDMRYEALTDPQRWRRLDIFEVIRQQKTLFLMANLALQSFQKRIGDQLGVEPGSELVAAARVAEEVGAEVVLADRHVQATLRRTWAALGFFEKAKMVGLLAGSLLAGDELEAEDIEALKERENFEGALEQFAKIVPSVREPLIEERDAFLISQVREASGKTVVAVVGAGHVAGMVDRRNEPVDRDRLSAMPTPSLAGRAVKWVIPTVILCAFGYGFYQHRGEGLLEMLYAWILPNAVAAGLLTLVAGGKLLSVLTAFVASPITSLNPTIGAGMVVGLVEAWLRKPTVEDCERLPDDMTTWKGTWNNPLSRILIVAIAATVGSALGAWVGATWVLTLLG